MLSARYLESLGPLPEDTDALRQVILRTLHLGIAWRDLLLWAVEAGLQDKAIRWLRSQLLLDSGFLRRRRGVGPATPTVALATLAYSPDYHAEPLAEKILHAAWRAIKKQRLVQGRGDKSFLK